MKRLIHGRGQEIRDEIGADIPTSSLPSPPPWPTLLDTPATLAAKPTEKVIESVPGQRSESGKRHHGPMDDPLAVKASLPAFARGSSRDLERSQLEDEGEGAGQHIGLRSMGRGFSRARTRAWHIRRDLHAGDEQR
jgi:hypothetical protein